MTNLFHPIKLYRYPLSGHCPPRRQVRERRIAARMRFTAGY